MQKQHKFCNNNSKELIILINVTKKVTSKKNYLVYKFKNYV